MFAQERNVVGKRAKKEEHHIVDQVKELVLRHLKQQKN